MCQNAALHKAIDPIAPVVLPMHMQKGESDEVRALKRKIRRKMIEAERVLLIAVNKWMRALIEQVMEGYDTAEDTTIFKAGGVGSFVEDRPAVPSSDGAVLVLKEYFMKLTGTKTGVSKADGVDIFVESMVDWELAVAAGIAFTKPAISNAFITGGTIAYDLAEFGPFPFDGLKARSAALVDEICSNMVTAVTDETKRAINVVIRNGIEQGKGRRAVGRLLRPIVSDPFSGKAGLTEQMIGWSANREERLLAEGFSRAQVDKKIAAYERKLHRIRNETIARTESARAMNEGQLQGFAEAGVEKVYWFALADRCPICDPHDGEEFTIRTSRGVLPFHPRCRCMWLPLKVAA